MVGIDPERLKSLVRRNELPFVMDANNPSDIYTVDVAFSTLVALELSRDGGLNNRDAATVAFRAADFLGAEDPTWWEPQKPRVWCGAVDGEFHDRQGAKGVYPFTVVVIGETMKVAPNFLDATADHLKSSGRRMFLVHASRLWIEMSNRAIRAGYPMIDWMNAVLKHYGSDRRI